MFLYGTTQFVSGNEKFGSFFGARTIGCWINHFGSCLFCLVFAVLVGAGWLWVGCFVNCIVDVSVFVDAFFEFLNLFCFWFVLVLLVAMGVRWMSWHEWLMKDVAACVIPWGVGERALIWGFPNGVT